MSENSNGLPKAIVERLREPLDVSRIKTRKAPGGGVVPYIEGHDAISQANEIFEFAWSMEIVGPIQHIATEPRPKYEYDKAKKRRVPVTDEDGNQVFEPTGLYFATVAITAYGVTHSDVGRCSHTGNTPEAHEMAIAGAVTDAMKRALRQFGDQFGNSLYDKESEAFKQATDGNAAWAGELTLEEARTAEIGFGKHSGKTMGQLADDDPGYLEWLANKFRPRNPGGRRLVAAARLILGAEKARGEASSEAPKAAPEAEKPTDIKAESKAAPGNG